METILSHSILTILETMPHGGDIERVILDAQRNELHASVAFALYWATAETYNGMGDPVYALHCVIARDVRPGPLCNGPSDDDPAELDLYHEFVRIFSR